MSINQENEMTDSEQKLMKAISHAVNFHNLDSKLNMADWKIGELLAPEVLKYLNGETAVQVLDAMTPERRAAIGREN